MPTPNIYIYIYIYIYIFFFINNVIFAQVIKIHHTVYMGWDARCICNPATEFPDVNELKMNAKCKGALNDRHLS